MFPSLRYSLNSQYFFARDDHADLGLPTKALKSSRQAKIGGIGGGREASMEKRERGRQSSPRRRTHHEGAHRNYDVLRPNQIVKNRYRILRRIGKGGMSEVYLATDMAARMEDHTGDSALVAIKVLSLELSDDEEFRVRFAKEAKVMSGLKDNNLVRVLNYGQIDSIQFIVMEYINGDTLKTLIQRYHRLPYDMAVHLTIQIALALDKAHGVKVVHRDMKPQNVLIADGMVAKVTDFGIAYTALIDDLAESERFAMGSLQYISPEQLAGKAVGGYSDIYSLGLTLYEMITGNLPFPVYKDDADLIRQQLYCMPKRPRSIEASIPQGLEDVIFRCIQKKPQDRYMNMMDLVRDLKVIAKYPNAVNVGLAAAEGSLKWRENLDFDASETDGAHYANVLFFMKKVKVGRRKKIFNYILLLLLIFSSSYFAYGFLSGMYHRVIGDATVLDADNLIVVGNYIGRHIEEVQDELAELNISPEISLENNDSIKAGNVFKQDPPSGFKADPAVLTLRLVVSRGKETVEVPSVDNLSAQDARDLLKEAGFNVLEKREFSPLIVKDKAVRTEPPAGSLIPKHENVSLFISDGQSKTLVPDLKGKTWEEAEGLCKEANLIITGVRASVSVRLDDEGNEIEDSAEIPIDERYILNQEKKPGETIAAGSQLMVTYGRKKDLKKTGDDNDVSQTRPRRELHKMGDYRGRQWSKVRDTINGFGIGSESIKLERTNTDIPYDDLYVIMQSIDEGIPVGPGSFIEFTLGTYEEYLQTTR